MIVEGNNIDFLIAALFISILTNVEYHLVFANDSTSNKACGVICTSSLAAVVGDLIFQVTKLPYLAETFWYGVGRLLYNVTLIFYVYSVYNYVNVLLCEKNIRDKKRRFVDYIMLSFVIFMTLASVINLFLHFFDSAFVNGEKIYGSGYYIQLIVPAVMAIIEFGILIRYARRLGIRQLIPNVVLTVASILFAFVEVVIKYDYLLTMFGVSITVMVFMMTLETKDYSMMVKSFSDLEESKLRAEQANMAKSDFLARMSHEIRTPMNAVLGMTEMIVEEAEDASIKSYATDAYNAGSNLLLIINDILDFSKIESGKMNLVLLPFDVREMIREEWIMFDIKAKEKNLKLNFNIDSSLPSSLVGDAVRIKQIITNILGNAVKYTAEGSVTLNIDLLELLREEATIKVCVSDTGRGIRKEDIAKLFEAFSRIDEKENAKIEGTGLGINITAKLLKLMDSELKVESEYGKGSKFYFTLKLHVIDSSPIGYFMDRADEKKDDSIGIKRELVASRAKVMVVDDTPLNLKVFNSLLKTTQIAVTSAASGEEAVKLAHIRRFDVIFMDHLMPGMDGIEALKAIRADGEGLNISTPVIALTANAIKGAEEMYKGYGFNDVTFKPYTRDELYRCLWKFIPADLFEE